MTQISVFVFRIEQFIGRLWWIGIFGGKREREAFWYHIKKRITRTNSLIPQIEAPDEDQLESGYLCDIAFLEKHGTGKLSIVILTYNNLELNKSCIESIYENTLYYDTEIIVVDNGSTDGTIPYLKVQEKIKRNLRVIFNPENSGFAAGNNMGIHAANGDYIVLLNNDTIVTKGWELSLLRHMVQNPKLGMCGPVTNSIGNEAKISIPASENVQDIVSYGQMYASLHRGEMYENPRVLAFFCVIIRKEVIEQCGGLDERYGRGMFEDDDYAQAVKRAGYGLSIAEDSFVYHFESASFSKITDMDFIRLFRRNRKEYEKKWGTIWKPHGRRKG